ncbi:hypothetical protein RsTz2092_01190 [Deferribacterales bacterium RsTz2092]|nr:hypothetical protein AGMMS49941_02080 [Deferribacterales bacterium]
MNKFTELIKANKPFVAGAVVAIIAIIAVLTSSNGSVYTPDATVNDFFSTLKKGNVDKTVKYTDKPLFDVSDEDKKLFSKYFATLIADNITVRQEEGNVAIATADVSAVDMFVIVNKFLEDLMNRIQTEGLDIKSVPQDQLNNDMLKAISASDAPRKSIHITFPLVKLDDKAGKRWVIQASESLRSDLLMMSLDTAEDMSGFETTETKTANATYLSEDTMRSGLCAFNVKAETLYMYCPDSDIDLLEKQVKTGKTTFSVVYDILENPSEPGVKVYQLNSFK